MRYAFGAFELDEGRLELLRDGAPVPVQPKTLDILLYLVKHRDRAVLKRELLEALWPGVTVTEAALWRAILRVRETIGDGDQTVVTTVRGRGFRFVAQVELRGEAAPAALPAPPGLDPTLVGRALALATIGARLDEALAGRGGAVLVTGPGGIGKTRLADEAARRARERGARVVAARIPADMDVPQLWPWSRVIDELVGADAAGQELRDALAAVGRAEGGSLEDCDAFARALSAAARRGPVVLVLDDLQRAGERSLALLRYLVGAVVDQPVLVVGAAGDVPGDDAVRARGIATLLAEVTHVVPLRGLGADEVVEVVERTRGRRPPPRLAQELLARSGGNPLYLHQLLKTEPVERALDDDAGGLMTTLEVGDGLALAIGRHLDELPVGSLELLTLAAVLGADVDLPRLVAVAGSPSEAVQEALEPARRRRLVVTSSGGGVRFDPPLIRDVLYGRIPVAERGELHRLAAERLLAHHGDAAPLHAAELARHFTRALPFGDAARALDFAIRAAEQATAGGKPRRAARSWRLAMQALTHLPGERARLVEAQLGLARALAGSGEAAAARAGFLDAAMATRALGLRDGLRAAAVGFAGVAGPAEAEFARRLLAEAEDPAG